MVRPIRNLRGMKFQNATPIRMYRDSAEKQIQWECRCDCGNFFIARGQSLISGHTGSCGCLQRNGKFRIKHGHSVRGEETPEHISWRGMKSRCYDPKNIRYKEYGGRGIKVCARWFNSFKNFLADMGSRPEETSLDRYPNTNGNYEPNNCRWATRSQQVNNRRPFKTRSMR